jgi:gamma-glutamyltranspeptidase/glutathione hydrolase
VPVPSDDWKAEGTGGVIATGGGQAAEAGASMLADGGNAADATAATLMALAVTDYGYTNIGGEAPLMIYDAAKNEVKTLRGQGGAPRDPEAIQWYLNNGIPWEGDIRATPVPGMLDLCVTALRLYGTVSFERAVSPTLALLDAGREDWHAPLAATLRKLVEAEGNAGGSRENKLVAARDRFYRGDVAETLCRWYESEGSFLRAEDLAAHETQVLDPVSADYRGYTVYKCGPWTQGPALCQALRILEGFDLEGMGHLSADYIHVIVEALKLAFADRDEYYADPDFAETPLDVLLSDEYTEKRRALIDMRSASMRFRPADPASLDGGTTTCVAADRWGNVVSATPSANPPYFVCEELGIAHGNRLRCLNTTPGHPNIIEPGKRPRLTLTPTLVERDGRVIIAVSVAGGDLQDQTTLNLLLDLIEFGMEPAEAVRAARFHTSHHQNSFRSDAKREKTVVAAGRVTADENIVESAGAELESRGHDVRAAAKPVGCPVMLRLDPETGIARAAGDPRTGRHARAI